MWLECEVKYKFGVTTWDELAHGSGGLDTVWSERIASMVMKTCSFAGMGIRWECSSGCADGRRRKFRVGWR